MNLKKITVAIIAFMFMLSGLVAFAEDITYEIDELGISIDLPEELYVFTRDTKPNDERLSAIGFSYEGLMSSFESKSIYLEGVNTDDFSEALVICEDSDSEDSDGFEKNISGSKAEYTLVKNGKAYTVKFVCYDGEITDEKETGFEAIVDSVVFEEEPAETDTNEPEDSEEVNTQQVTEENAEKSEAEGYDSVTYYVILIGAVMAILLIITRILRRR